jgi:hypothetical protein
MKTLVYIGLSALVCGCLLSGCVSPPTIDSRQLDDKQAKELAAIGANNFGIKWEGPLVGAGEHGVSAVTDGVTTLTTRPGNRIFIIHSRKEFPPSDKNSFTASDAELKSIGMKLLLAAGAREDEIAEVRVLQQFTQSGETQPGSKVAKLLPIQKSHRTLLISRRVKGIEVVSSRLMLNVDSGGRAAFMELAWPDISSEVLDRAARYMKLAENKEVAPRLEGASVESVEAVVLHSPAVAFYNDATAAIRVIYRPNAKQVGQKAVRYIDERGEEVILPRDVDRLREEPLKRAEERK